jgi:hypothetical protein
LIPEAGRRILLFAGAKCMTRRGSSFGLFGIFGRSSDLRQFDNALRSLDLHPRLVPEAVKLTAVNLLKDHAPGAEPAPQSYRAAAELLAYCMIGAEGFAAVNGDPLAGRVEDRIESAVRDESSLDAQIILLTLHAKVVQPEVVRAFGLESAEKD